MTGQEGGTSARPRGPDPECAQRLSSNSGHVADRAFEFDRSRDGEAWLGSVAVDLGRVARRAPPLPHGSGRILLASVL